MRNDEFFPKRVDGFMMHKREFLFTAIYIYIYIRQESTARHICNVTRNMCVVASARFVRASASRNLLLRKAHVVRVLYQDGKEESEREGESERERKNRGDMGQLQFPYYN